MISPRRSYNRSDLPLVAHSEAGRVIPVQSQAFTCQIDAVWHTVIDDPRVKFEYIERPKESIVAPFDTDLFRVIEQETKVVYPESITLPHLIIYGTDSRFFRPKGAICYGFYPGPVTMEEYRKIHGNDERVRTESIRNAVRIYYNVVKEFCRVK